MTPLATTALSTAIFGLDTSTFFGVSFAVVESSNANAWGVNKAPEIVANAAIVKFFITYP